MLVGTLQSHETTSVCFVTIVRNNLFNHELSIDPGLDGLPNGKHPNLIPLCSFYEVAPRSREFENGFCGSDRSIRDDGCRDQQNR